MQAKVQNHKVKERFEPGVVAQASRTPTTELRKHTSIHPETWPMDEARE